jgi:hypothetical protein
MKEKETPVLVRTSPPGATVAFDNQAWTACKSPCAFSLPAGRHTVTASLAGHRPALRIFRAPQELDLFLYLAPMTGQVNILSNPPGAVILINGKERVERTPAILELSAGKYTIAVTKEGYKRVEQEIEVKDSAFLRLDFSL